MRAADEPNVLSPDELYNIQEFNSRMKMTAGTLSQTDGVLQATLFLNKALETNLNNPMQSP